MSGAAALGTAALAAVVEQSRDGIVVVTADRRYVYANPAACRIMGYTLDELRALPDFLANFPEREHAAMLEHFAEQLSGHSGLWTSTLLRPDGTEREITWSNMTFDIDGRPHGAAVFRDTTDARQAARNAAALGQAAAQLAGGSPLWEVLGQLATHAVEGTRAVACAIATCGEDGTLRAGGAANVPAAFRDASLTTGLRLADIPDGDVVLSGRTAIVPDARARWLTGTRADIGATLQDIDWGVRRARPAVVGRGRHRHARRLPAPGSERPHGSRACLLHGARRPGGRRRRQRAPRRGDGPHLGAARTRPPGARAARLRVAGAVLHDAACPHRAAGDGQAAAARRRAAGAQRRAAPRAQPRRVSGDARAHLRAPPRRARRRRPRGRAAEAGDRARRADRAHHHRRGSSATAAAGARRR